MGAAYHVSTGAQSTSRNTNGFVRIFVQINTTRLDKLDKYNSSAVVHSSRIPHDLNSKTCLDHLLNLSVNAKINISIS